MVTGVQPERIIIIDKTIGLDKIYSVQWLLEQEIFVKYNADSQNKHRHRVLALLHSRDVVDITNSNTAVNEPMALLSTIDSASNTAVKMVFTKKYSSLKLDENQEIYSVTDVSSRVHNTAEYRFATPSSHNNHHIYYAHDLTQSKIYGNYTAKSGSPPEVIRCRILSILIPAYINVPGSLSDDWEFEMPLLASVMPTSHQAKPSLRNVKVAMD